MGSATLDLTTLDLARSNELTFSLQDPSRPDACLGEIYISATLYPKSQEDKEQVSILFIYLIYDNVIMTNLALLV